MEVAQNIPSQAKPNFYANDKGTATGFLIFVRFFYGFLSSFFFFSFRLQVFYIQFI